MIEVVRLWLRQNVVLFSGLFSLLLKLIGLIYNLSQFIEKIFYYIIYVGCYIAAFDMVLNYPTFFLLSFFKAKPQ